MPKGNKGKQSPKGNKNPGVKDPPKTNASTVESKVGELDTSICVLCGVADEEWLVGCDQCKRWYHFACVHIEEIGEEDSWSCEECLGRTKSSSEPLQDSCTNEIIEIENSENLDSRTDRPHQAQHSISTKAPLDTVVSLPPRQSTQLRGRCRSMVNLDGNRNSDRRSPSFDAALKRVIASTPSKQSQQGSKLKAHVEVRATSDRQAREDVGNNSRRPVLTRKSQEIPLSKENVIAKSLPSNSRAQSVNAKSPSSLPLEPLNQQPRIEDCAYSDDNVYEDTRRHVNDPVLTPDELSRRIYRILRPPSEVPQSVSSKTTSSSRSRKEAELRRLHEELDLQTKIDEEEVAVKLKARLEALSLKEKREKRFLEEKFKMMDEERTNTESKGSKPSRCSRTTNRSELATAWIQSQRNQILKSSVIPLDDTIRPEDEKNDILGLDLTLEPYELKQLKLEQRRSQEQRLREANETFVKPTKQLDPEAPAVNWNKPKYERPSEQNQRHENERSNPNEGPHPPVVQHQVSTKQSLNYNNQSMTKNRLLLHKPSGRDTQSMNPPIIREQPSIHPYNPNWYSKHSPDDQGQQDPLGNQSAISNQSRQNPCSSSRYQRPQLTANQIAARHIVSKKLPYFSGDPGQWSAFYEKYNNTTDICGLDNTENLDRLFDSLKGNAREIVKHQLSRPACVPAIIETLKQKYGRPEIIVKMLLNDIRAEPSIKADNLEALSNFGYRVQGVCQSIEEQKVDYFLHNPELIQEIIDKLPYQTKIDWARFSESLSQITLSTLSDWLVKLSRSLNRITTPEVPKQSNDRKSEWKSENSGKSGYVNAHDNDKSRETNESKCKVCQKSCKCLEDCSKFKELSVDDRWKAIYSHREVCRGCLRVHGRQCPTWKECEVNGCVLKHHPLLHDNQKQSKTRANTKVSSPAPKRVPPISPSKSHENCNAHRGGQSVLYKILPVTLKNGEKRISTYAYMDDGSGLTIMEQDLANELGLIGSAERLCLRWTSGTIRHEDDSRRVALDILSNEDESRNYRLRNARTVRSLDLPMQNINRQSLTKKYPYLEKVPFQDFKAKPRILIGLDNIKLGLSRECVEGGWTEPIASKTLLGWVIHGPIGDPPNGESQHMQHHVMSISCNGCPCQLERDQELHQRLEEFFSLENFGTRALTSSIESKDIQRARRIMEETIARKNGRFEVGLLWKYDDVQLPNSYRMAIKRLQCQERKMLANPVLMENINNQIQDFISKGYIRKLTSKEIHAGDPRTCYLPLFHHLDPKKPEKVRLVWDAAAKVDGISLNSMLLSGPDNLVALIDILRRFREKIIAISGDIQEMYHQIAIRKEDHNSQRFLWRSGGPQSIPDVYLMQVMTFGATCSPSLAQFVKNRNASDFESQYPKAAAAIKGNHYVDDWLDCQHTVEETIQLAKEVKHVHSQGGFKLRKFVSNSTEVIRALGEEDDQTSKDLDVETVLGTQRVLGMWWNTQTDCFTYSLRYTKLNEEVLRGIRAPTKRELLKTLMSIYDPLGLIAFFLAYLKMILQEVWKRKVDWDEQLPEDLCRKWNKWIKLLPEVETVRIPRLYSRKISPGVPKSIELHTFVDASENAYCAVCYLRIIDDEGVECTLVGAKTKVSPIKPLLTIPRLELLAAVLGTRLAKNISASLTVPINKRIFWSDSRDVLCWIRSIDRKYRQFVAFRVGEILETSAESEWRWVPGKLNAADEGTKWSKLPKFGQDSRWFRGPEFLWNDPTSWPQDLSQGEITEEELHVHYALCEAEPPSRINPDNISRLWVAIKAQALSTRYLEKLFAKVRGQSLKGPITSDELLRAENALYRLAQWDCFSEEIATLRQNERQFGDKAYVDKSSTIHNCSPYMDEDGLLRVRGRIDKLKQVPYNTRRPIILPRRHRITSLVVDSYHRRYLHKNDATVINELNQKYFIPRVRMVLKRVIAECQLCKNNKAKPIVPEMGDLPIARLSPGFRPFTYTGVDYFGPMYVIVNRGTQKRWGVLFTCLTVRAIHIEIAPSLTTDSCIVCIRNFTSIRGTPLEFFSDNGTNLKGADTELSKEFEKIDQEELQSKFTRTYSKWNFNPPASPHMAGSWERLIRSVKDNLKHIMPTRTPKEELLRGYLLEVANIINSRPLTYIEVDSPGDEALTPNHFLLGSSNGIKAPGEFPYEEQVTTKTWKRYQQLTNMFWRRWIKEYLPTLTRRSKWFQKAKPIEVGDVVLVADEKNSRNCYPKGIVVEVMPDKGGQVRSATLRMAKGMLTRPANKLAVLDVAGKREIEAVMPVDDPVTKCPNGGENVESAINTDSKIDTDHTTTNEGNFMPATTDRRNHFSKRRSKRIAAKANKSKISSFIVNRSSLGRAIKCNI